MPIARMIYVKVDPAQSPQAEKLWKEHCAPLMIQQPGCLSERLLKCMDAPGEFVSYSEWDDQPSIDQYLKSQAHQEIVRHARTLKPVESTVVKRYEEK